MYPPMRNFTASEETDKVQVNKNADSSTLRKLAQEDSHKVWAEAEIEMEMEAKDGGTGEDQGEGDTDVRKDPKGDRAILKTAFIA